MSEPDVKWYIECIEENLKDIDKFIDEPVLTNSMREIIHHDVNEIWIKLHTIIRKLSDGNEPRQDQSPDKTG